MSNVFFLMAIHNHQPIGNFDSVIEEAYKKAYLPFLEVLERHKGIRVSLHCSGILYDWFEEHHPEYFNLISRLIREGQLELLTGGYYEPILPMIPDRDKVEQVRLFSNYIRKKFVFAPKGLWLSERVWEPELVKHLSDAKVQFTMVDDYHFNSIGLFDDSLTGYYITEDNNKTISIFPINKKLRYAIPYQPVNQVIDSFRGFAQSGEDTIITFGDDGEKFGVWPKSYHLVYEEGWLDQFFSAIESNSDWLKMLHFSEVLERFKPRDRVYIPTASYSEMMEWVLPSSIIPEYKKFSEQITQSEKLSYGKKFIRGGFWRNYLVKYPESNQMQKKAVFVSAKIPSTSPDVLKKELFKGECSCSYWHGSFGGIYLPNLRDKNYEHLIRAEYAADLKRIKNKRTWLKRRILDFDCDGFDEILLENAIMNMYISPAYGGSIFELDLKGDKYINLTNTISRKEEGYHHLLKKENVSADDETVSITPDVKVKEEGLEKYLIYDWYLRRSLLDHIMALDTTLDKFSNMDFWELSDFIKNPYKFTVKKGKNYYRVRLNRRGELTVPMGSVPWEIEKVVDFFSNSRTIKVKYIIKNHSENGFDFIFGSEFNFSMQSAVNPGKFIYSGSPDTRVAGLASSGIESSIKQFGIVDNDRGIEIGFKCEDNTDLWYFPVETVSQSEEGLERVYQETCLLINKHVTIPAKESWTFNFDLTIKTSND